MINFKNNILSIESKVIDAIESLQNSKLKTCFIIDSENVVVGTVTDGDIRRGFLDGVGTNEIITKVMNKKLIKVGENAPTLEIEGHRRRKKFAVPVLDDKGKLVDLLLSSDLSSNKNLPNKVFILAGGLGKRLGNLTKEVP